MTGNWFTEAQTPDLAISCRVKQILHQEKTPYQEIKVADTQPFGRMLILDDVIQTSILDEFCYHEMLCLVPLNSHPAPRQVLVIGGGDGGSVRECVRHPGVEKVTLVEIDRRVLEVAGEFLPELAGSTRDAKAEVIFGDGIAYVQDKEAVFDVVIIDSTDPVGPARELFARPFYERVHRALKPDGVMVAQMESPFYNGDLIKRVYRDLRQLFPVVSPYLGVVPTYPGGLWMYMAASKKYDPGEARERAVEKGRYYSLALHRAAFVLPTFVKELLAD